MRALFHLAVFRHSKRGVFDSYYHLVKKEFSISYFVSSASSILSISTTGTNSIARETFYEVCLYE